MLNNFPEQELRHYAGGLTFGCQDNPVDAKAFRLLPANTANLSRKTLARRQHWTRAPLIWALAGALRAPWRGLREWVGFSAHLHLGSLKMSTFRTVVDDAKDYSLAAVFFFGFITIAILLGTPVCAVLLSAVAFWAIVGLDVRNRWEQRQSCRAIQEDAIPPANTDSGTDLPTSWASAIEDDYEAPTDTAIEKESDLKSDHDTAVPDKIDSSGIRNVTNLIERLEVFEERAGIRLEAIGAISAMFFDQNKLKVYGELHPREGTVIKKDVVITVDLYDNSGSVVGTSSQSIRSRGFFGFETFHVTILVTPLAKTWAKIRVIPRPQG